MPPDEPPFDIGVLFALERTRLLELLGGLSQDDWDRPTPCPGWTVLGLCSHLVGDDFGVLARGRDAHFGTVAPAGGEDEFISWLDALQVEWVHAARRLSPRLVVELLTWTGPQLVEHFSLQDPRPRTADVSWAASTLVPVWLDQLRELSEHWIHRQQLRTALGLPDDMRADLAGPVLDGLRWAYPFRLSPLKSDAGDTVSITVGPPLSVEWPLVLGPSGWDFLAEPGARTIARLRLSASDAWRLLTNNLVPDRQRELDISGRADVVEVLRRTRAIIGHPN